MRAALLACGLLALAVTQAHAQSADLVLCDRVAAEPSDPDKPADVRGVNEIAPSDIATAIKFCKNASGSSRRALFALGRAYAANRQMPDAIAAFRKAADKGSSAAMVELGVMYGNGTGVPRDEAQARALLERAAQAGNARGVANLAALSSNTGAQTDPVRARALLTKAAETNAEAQYQLGLMMADGAGGPQDETGARALFERAAAQNHPGALERMGEFARTGRGGPKDSSAAKAYYERSAALGNEDAKAALKRDDCPVILKDKSGKKIGNLCW
jgi:TPR repeat protein